MPLKTVQQTLAGGEDLTKLPLDYCRVWIHQQSFCPFFPRKGQKELSDRYRAELHKYTDKGHFQNTKFHGEIGIMQGMLEETTLTKSHSFRAEKVCFLLKQLTVEGDVPEPTQNK